MARTRNIKPGFFTNDDLGECQPLARLLYAGLWCHADREGSLEDRPKKLKVDILPWDECDIDTLLNELVKAGQIIRYEVDGVRYIAVPTFCEHQNPHVKEPASTIPAPGKNRASTRQAGKRVDPISAGTGPAPVEPGLLPSPNLLPPIPPKPPRGRREIADEPPGFSEFYDAFPRREARRSAAKAYAAALKRASAEQIRAGAERYAAQRQGQDQKFTKLPATWLNSDCWLDQPVQPQPAEGIVALDPSEQRKQLERKAKWSGHLADFRNTGLWQSAWGEPPWTGNNGCFVPPEFREAFTAEHRRREADLGIPDSLRRTA